MLELKDGFEEGEEEVLAGGRDEDAAPVALVAGALEDGLEDGELAAGVEVLAGAAVVCAAVVGAACEEGVGVGLAVALGTAVETGVDTGA